MSWYWPQENSRSLPVRCSKAIIRSKDEVEVMGKDRMLLLLVVEPSVWGCRVGIYLQFQYFDYARERPKI